MARRAPSLSADARAGLVFWIGGFSAPQTDRIDLEPWSAQGILSLQMAIA